MRKSVRVVAWAVYQAAVQGQPGPNVVCTQAEWEAMADGQPEAYRLIRDGITNEGEAERLARGASGEVKKRVIHKKAADLVEAGESSGPAAGEEAGCEDVPAEERPLILPFTDVPEIVDELALFDRPEDDLEQSA